MSLGARCLVLSVAVFGWFFAGMQMAATSLTMRTASLDLLSLEGTIDLARYRELSGRDHAAAQAEGTGSGETLTSEERELLSGWNAVLQRWFGWFVCAFLFGAAGGGWIFGRLGDRIGRARALVLSIFWFAAFALACHLARSAPLLLGLWFLSCLGIGGTWPNGVALVSEVWADLSRPVVAGVMGSAANVGIFVMGAAASSRAITLEDWRWVFWISAAPLALAVFAFFVLPESPRWLKAARAARSPAGSGGGGPRASEIDPRAQGGGPAPAPEAGRSGTSAHPRMPGARRRGPAAVPGSVFRPPYLKYTVLGIALATVPLIGGWGSANWMVPWADEAGQAADPPNPYLKAQVSQYRSLTGIAGSLLGGWIASVLGRRRTYALISLGALFCAQTAFWFTVPTDASFLVWVAALGFFNGLYFGWLPLFLPELFPTAIRATGSGVSFNFGRIFTAGTVFLTAAIVEVFGGDYAAIGRVTSWVFLFGIIAIAFAPDTTRRGLADEGGEI